MTIQEFYHDKETRKEVQDYLIQFINDEILKRAYKGEETAAVGEAKIVIDKAFDNLETLFASKPKKKVVKNTAR